MAEHSGTGCRGGPEADRAGVRLRDWLGLSEKQFYDPLQVAIVPMGFCFPGHDAKGGDLPPRPECAPLWRSRIFALLPNIKLIILLGQSAQRWHLGVRRKKTLTETVKNWRNFLKDSENRKFMVLPHPSWRNNGWLRRNSWFEREVLPELRERVKALNLS